MKRVLIGLGLMALSAAIMVDRANAQAVVSDGTLNTIVTQSGNTFTIDNGTPSGSNLFHSFREFSIPTGGSAIFNNATNLQNIFSRVTGGTPSNIDGLIRANGTANLFLLNPSGILFGANASLNIGGSFVGTTANSIKFADGFELSAVNATSPPLLTVSAPIGLQMGQNPGAIVNNGAQLTVAQGNTFALIGGEIRQTGGALNVLGGNGRIELVSLGENSQAGIQAAPGGWAIDTRNSQTFRDLQFTQGALVAGNGNGSASINVAGRNLLLSDKSRFQGYNKGNLAGGAVSVNASESILVAEDSEIRTETEGSGSSGNLFVSAPKITLYNGGAIASVGSQGTGKAGDILVQGKEVTLTSHPSTIVNGFATRGSALVTVSLSQGNAGDIKVIADALTYDYGAGLANMTLNQGNSGTTTLMSRTMTVRNTAGGNTTTSGSGNGGDINIITDTFYMDGRGPGRGGYTTSSGGSGTGKAGNINVTARSIIAFTGSFTSSTTTSGNAGNITLRADSIELDNFRVISRSTSAGKAGNIDISTQNLRLLNGAQLNVTARASGNGGNVLVNAKTIELNGQPTSGTLANKSTGILSSVVPNAQNPKPTANGGSIRVTASDLLIRDGALISASTSAGTGNGGNILLDVDRLDAFNGGQIMNVTRGAGNAGTITVNARDHISISGADRLHTARQSAYVLGQGAADVEYNISPFSGIYGNATGSAVGNGGSVEITTGKLRLQDGAIVNVSSLGTGNAGNLTVNANQVRLDQGSIQSESTAGTQGNLFFNLNQALLMRNGSTITTNATGTANGGNMTINAPIMLGLENSDIIANAVQGRGGNINITTQGIVGLVFRNTLTPREDLTNDITASSQFNLNGTVQINNIGVDPNSGLIKLSESLIDPSQKISEGCAENQGNSFVISGRGGMPQNPINEARNDLHPWADLRDLSAYRNPRTVTAQLPTFPEPIVQATDWQRNPQTGKVELIAAQAVPSDTAVTCAIAPESGV